MLDCPILLSSIITLISFLTSASTTWAADEEHAHSHEHEGHDHAEAVAYQLADWHEMEFANADKAAQHLKAVKELGCEAKQVSHDGHIDIVYRCPEWKRISIENHKLAEQWSGWLKGSGFDIHHGHVDESLLDGDETVQLRLVEWKTVHLEGEQLKTGKAMVESLEKIGCGIKNETHDDHADIAYRCPVWTTIHAADHASAEKLLAWLKKNGFETKHAD